jgi:sarcosine oxidase, subunit beta
MSQPSVCIIGGGAVGLASALQLARRGVTDVTVLEAEHPAAGSSGLSVGIIETQYLTPLDIELRVRAMRFFDELERDHGLHVTRNGYLRIAHNEDTLAGFRGSIEIQRELGVADARVLDPAEIAELVPDMRTDDVAGGLYGPSDGFIDGHLYCGLLQDLATELGVKVLGRNRVSAVRADGDGHVVVTARGEHRCDVVVNAAGAWGGRVGELLGAPMPLQPQRHSAVVVHLREPLPYVMPSVMLYTPHTGDNGLYFRHERPGQMIAGLHSEEALEEVGDPDRYARGADEEFLVGVAEKISDRLPSLADSSLAHGWSGLYPVSPDGVPQVGPHPADATVISAGGAGGSGIQLSPVLGELVADWIVHGEPRAVSGGDALQPGRPTLEGAAASA